MIIAILLLSLVLLGGVPALAVIAMAQEAAGAEFESWDRGSRSITDLTYDALVERSDRLALALA